MRNPATKERNALLARLNILTSITDTYEAIPEQGMESKRINLRGDIYKGVWETTAELRRSGELLAYGKHIRCPVIAIHGDYDPIQRKVSNNLCPQC